MKKLTTNYSSLVKDLSSLLESARRTSARVVNTVMTTTYWEIGRRIVEFEQAGERRAGYGEELIEKLAIDLSARFGRGFAKSNVAAMKAFYIAYSNIFQTVSGKFALAKCQTSSSESALSIFHTPSGKFNLQDLTIAFPLSWSHYTRLLSVKNEEARKFYETEALRGGWSVRQLDRQISSLFYERIALSKDKAKMLKKGTQAHLEDISTAEEEIKNPLVLEFLGLKDEYSENDLEEALIQHLEVFLLELGSDFAFLGRQKRLRIGNEWYRVDLLFFHRQLKCLIIIDLKVGKFTHADAGQMHLYLNYAREHWTHADENPPVGLILCAEKDAAVARYALEGLPNKVVAREYKINLPNEKLLIAEIKKTRKLLETSKKREHNDSKKYGY